LKSNMIHTLTLGMVCLILSGCASGWRHPIKGENDLVADKYKCTQESAALYPPLLLNSPFQAGYMYPRMGYYSPYSYRSLRRGYYVSPAFTWQDYNEPARNKAFSSCLNTLGWEWIFKW